MPKHAQPKPGEPADHGHREHPPRRIEPEHHRHDHRDAAIDTGPGRDPQRLGADELLGVDGCREDCVVRALELVLDERPEHGRERAGEEDRCGHRPGPDEVDVAVTADRAHQRAEAEAEGQQVDRRLDRGGEGARLPVGRVVHDLAHQHTGEGGALEAAETSVASVDGRHQPISSPVSNTKTSSRLAARRSPSIAKPLAPSTPRIEMLVPVRRVRIPAAPASASTSASRAGGP